MKVPHASRCDWRFRKQICESHVKSLTKCPRATRWIESWSLCCDAVSDITNNISLAEQGDAVTALMSSWISKQSAFSRRMITTLRDIDIQETTIRCMLARPDLVHIAEGSSYKAKPKRSVYTVSSIIPKHETRKFERWNQEKL